LVRGTSEVGLSSSEVLKANLFKKETIKSPRTSSPFFPFRAIVITKMGLIMG